MKGVNNTIDWDVILSTIREEKCVLFLGPELYAAGDEELDARLASYLNVKTDPDIRKYEDGLFFFRDPKKRTLVYYKIKDFYAQPLPETAALFEKIAQIPFALILTLTPDKLLWEKHRDLNIRAKEGFYWKKQAIATDLPAPAKSSPVIYNILGSTEQLESMVLTHNDLFDYFESIFQGNSLPEKLRHFLKEANNYIFLGIAFEKWYMQLLLRILYLHTNENLLKFASNLDINQSTQTFYHEQFQISFVPANIRQFVDELYQRAEAKGLLRSAGKESPVLDTIIDIIGKDEMEKAFELFAEFLRDKGTEGLEFEKELTLLESRHARLERKVRMNVISFNESEVEANRIRESLMDLLLQAKSLE